MFYCGSLRNIRNPDLAHKALPWPTMFSSIVDSRGLFLTWHNHTYPGKTVTLPLSETEIKTFFVSCAGAGFTYTRLTNNILRGICMWVSILPKRDPPRETSLWWPYLKRAVLYSNVVYERGETFTSCSIWNGREFCPFGLYNDLEGELMIYKFKGVRGLDFRVKVPHA